MKRVSEENSSYLQSLRRTYFQPPTKVHVEFVAPDLNPQARAIQRAYRAFHARRVAAILVISALLKRRRILAVWYNLVDEVWERAYAAAVTIQRIARGMLGQSKMERKRDEVIMRLTSACTRSTSRLLDDVRGCKGFLDNESRNWRAFGISSWYPVRGGGQAGSY